MVDPILWRRLQMIAAIVSLAGGVWHILKSTKTLFTISGMTVHMFVIRYMIGTWVPLFLAENQSHHLLNDQLSGQE